MKNVDRLLIIKLMNAAYRLAYIENAVETQQLLSAMIQFLRRYMTADHRQVRMKDEIDSAGILLDMLGQISGKRYHLKYEAEEVEGLYLPANCLVAVLAALLADVGEPSEKPVSIVIHASQQVHFLQVELLAEGLDRLEQERKRLAADARLKEDSTAPHLEIEFINSEEGNLLICMRISTRQE